MKRTLTYSLLALMAAGSMAAAQDRTSRFRSSGSSSGSSVAPSSERPSDATPRPRKMEEPYTILQNTSIFARDRRTGTAVEPTNTTPPPNPETYYAFRGAAEENGKIVAFLEDTRDGSTMRYGVGEEIASGKITDITLDSIKYERRDGMLKTTINLGCDLSGRESAVEVADSSSSSSSSSSSNSANGPTGVDAINNYRRFNNGGGRGFGPGSFGSSGYDSGGGYRQRGFGGPSSFGGQKRYGTDGGGFRQRGFDRSQGGSGYGQQDFGGGRRRQRDFGG
jgi:hypothetical protein